MAKVLTAAAVLRLRPGTDRREIRDGGCPALYLIIQKSGFKSWALRIRRPSGVTAKLTLGPVDLSGFESEAEPVIGQPLTLAAARRLAAELHRQRAMGKDIVAVQHRAKLERQVRGAATFVQATSDFVRQYAMHKQRRWQQTSRLLGWLPTEDGDIELIPKGLSDRWCDRPLPEITGDDIHFLIDEVREHGLPGLMVRRSGESEARARMLYAVVSTLFTWLVEKRRLVANPCIGLSRPEASVARERSLSNAEIIKLWQATETARVPFGQIIRLALLTGCRLREIADARRSEFTDDFAVWEIPSSRTKNRRPHVIQLPPMARAMLASVPRRHDGDLIFTWGNGRRISGFGQEKRQLDQAMGIPAWRIHDLRRCFATGLADIGIAPHVIEACLNHVSGHKAGVAGTYNISTYGAERKAALERWASHVESLLSGEADKVIPFGRA
jgi:integrase